MQREYSIAIVDDEPLARYSFSTLIGNEHPNLRLIGEASTGIEGIELYKKHKPDIIVIDIKIPVINGLELSKQILAMDPAAQIIILSAYDTFEYVQEAINSGVLGYLLKPVQNDKFVKLMSKAVERIEGFKEQVENKHYRVTYRYLAISEMVSAFMYGRKGGISARAYTELVNEDIRSGYFAVFRFDGKARFLESDVSKVYRYIEHYHKCYLGSWMGPFLPMFVSRSEENSETVRGEAKFLVREIAHRIGTVMGGTISAGVGSLKTKHDQFSQSFREAFDALGGNPGKGVIIFAENSDSIKAADRFAYPLELEKEFLGALKLSDASRAEAAGTGIADRIMKSGLSITDIRLAFEEFLIQVKRHFGEVSGDTVLQIFPALQRELYYLQDLTSMDAWFRTSLEVLIETFCLPSQIEGIYLRKAIRYIDLNDFRDIYLDKVAEIVGITPQYLSRLFKERFGMNFIDYIIERRLDRACELLSDTKLTVKEIAESVGYGDVNYFSKIFKKKTGKSPREYRISG